MTQSLFAASTTQQNSLNKPTIENRFIKPKRLKSLGEQENLFYSMRSLETPRHLKIRRALR